MNESITNHRSPPTRTNSHIPITMTLCSSDKQICSTSFNAADHDSMSMSTLSPPKGRTRQPTLRINFKEKKSRPSMPLPLDDGKRSSLKRVYSFVDKQHCAQVNIPRWWTKATEEASSLFLGWTRLVSSRTFLWSFSFSSITEPFTHSHFTPTSSRFQSSSERWWTLLQTHTRLPFLSSLLKRWIRSDTRKSSSRFFLLSTHTIPSTSITVPSLLDDRSLANINCSN